MTEYNIGDRVKFWSKNNKKSEGVITSTTKVFATNNGDIPFGPGQGLVVKDRHGNSERVHVSRVFESK